MIMAFQISPGVNVSEIDLSTIVPAVSTTTGGIAGHFRWGPVQKRVLIDNEDTLALQFGKPNSNTAADFFTASSFLGYGNQLFVVRVINESGTTSNARNATTNAANTTNTVIKSDDDYELNFSSGITGTGGWVAKYPGELGNWSLRNKIAKFSLLHEEFYTTQKTKNHFLSKGLDISKRNTPDRTRNGFTFEHPIMCKYIADYLLEKKPGLKKLTDILMETNYVVILTQEENKLFSKFKLSRNMPTGWKIGDDPFAKYKVAGIKVLKKKIRMHGKLISR
jgi:hypothetical protein